MNKQRSVAGAQSAAKALELLSLVSANHIQGMRLSEAVEKSGLDRSTTHRLLACLVSEGFVDRAEPSRLYRLGIEAVQVGLRPSAMSPLIERFRPVVQELARLSGDTVHLIVQSGDHALCIHREEGAYPVKALLVEPGTRRMLGASAVGIGILSRMTDTEVEASYDRQVSEYRKLAIPLVRLRNLINETRAHGYSQTSEISAGEVRGVGCAVKLSESSFAGVSIAAINARMTAQRRQELGRALVEALRPFEPKPGGRDGEAPTDTLGGKIPAR